MDGWEFEKYVAGNLHYFGYVNAVVTRGLGDFGADVIAYKDGVKTAIQCKYLSKDVGIKAVQEIYAARVHYGCGAAVVVTNAGFTKAAITLAQETGVRLEPNFVYRVETCRRREEMARQAAIRQRERARRVGKLRDDIAIDGGTLAAIGVVVCIAAAVAFYAGGKIGYALVAALIGVAAIWRSVAARKKQIKKAEGEKWSGGSESEREFAVALGMAVCWGFVALVLGSYPAAAAVSAVFSAVSIAAACLCVYSSRRYRLRKAYTRPWGGDAYGGIDMSAIYGNDPLTEYDRLYDAERPMTFDLPSAGETERTIRTPVRNTIGVGDGEAGVPEYVRMIITGYGDGLADLESETFDEKKEAWHFAKVFLNNYGGRVFVCRCRGRKAFVVEALDVEERLVRGNYRRLENGALYEFANWAYSKRRLGESTIE
ncbi:MAG: restriction endonuclease [Firmicutes bacterium]|nr:restriction endonuclease [Bacillota bacterium]